MLNKFRFRRVNMEVQNVSGVGQIQGRIQSDRVVANSEPASVVPQQQGSSSPNQLPDPESFNLDIYA